MVSLKLESVKKYTDTGYTKNQYLKLFRRDSKGKCNLILETLRSRNGEMIPKKEMENITGSPSRAVNILMHSLKNREFPVKIEKREDDFYYGIFENLENLKD